MATPATTVPTTANKNAAMKLDINNYLNNDYNQYLNDISSLALARPNEYFKYRENVTNYIKTEAIRGLYDVIFNALRYGRRTVKETGLPSAEVLSPEVKESVKGKGTVNMSENTINEKCIAIASTLNHFLDEIVNDLCPVDATSLSQSRLAQMGNVRSST